MPNILNRLVQLFRRHFGASPKAVVELEGDGSARSYWRLVGPGAETAIGALGPDAEENTAFFSFSRSFHAMGLPVPELYGVDAEAGVWLEEDLGDTTLFEALTAARDPDSGVFPEAILDLYLRTVEVLPRFQVEGAERVDFEVCYPRAAFDRQSMLWDLNYFKYHFLKLAHVPFNEARLEGDFHTLVEFLLEVPLDGFLYRDFQSRNVMVRDGEPWFIDYQGGRRGAPHYDVASLLFDAKADLPPDVRERILGHYLDVLSEHRPVDRDAFREHYRGFVLIRIMQAMGAYGYRGFFERKPRFLLSVPYAAENVAQVLEEGLPLELPEVERAFRHIVRAWAPEAGGSPLHEGLTLRVASFSYKGGYPDDRDGHGGGYVFDCRALPNPGRRLEYRDLSGLDDAVVDHLAGIPEVEEFWEHVRRLVDSQIREYLRRGFTSLSVSFGCTGGQHRSVYLGDRLARHVHAHHPEVRVEVEHRESRRWPGTDAGRPERLVDAAPVDTT
jgi:aminoglycoside/choline kinase family phosphotransferase